MSPAGEGLAAVRPAQAPVAGVVSSQTPPPAQRRSRGGTPRSFAVVALVIGLVVLASVAFSSRSAPPTATVQAAVPWRGLPVYPLCTVAREDAANRLIAYTCDPSPGIVQAWMMGAWEKPARTYTGTVMLDDLPMRAYREAGRTVSFGVRASGSGSALFLIEGAAR